MRPGQDFMGPAANKLAVRGPINGMNIVEFAKLLNISTGTVSRALNDRAEVSPKTRQLVLEKARELGFTRNANARRLVTGRNFLIRLECPHNTHVLSDRYLVELARSVEEALGVHGYDLHLRLGPRRSNVVAPDTQPVDGLVLITAPDTTVDDLTALTNDGRVPSVVVPGHAPLDFAKASYVCIDTLTGVGDAVRVFASRGHKRIGYIGSGRPGSHVRAGFPQILEAAGLTFDPDLAIEAGVTHEDGHRAAVALLRRPSPPTAIFARTDILAVGAMQGAQSLGLSIPADVAVIGHDDIEVAALVNPPLTTVSIDIPQIGRVATEMLLDLIEHDGAPGVRFLAAHLIERKSA